MPCLAITFGHAPQAEHRRLSQSATMASRTRNMGRFDGGFSNTFSARLTPFRQAFVACLSTTARNKTLTHEIAGPATMTGYGEPWGSEFTDRVIPPKHEKLGCASRLLRVSCRNGMRRVVACFWAARSGCKALDGQRVASDFGHRVAA